MKNKQDFYSLVKENRKKGLPIRLAIKNAKIKMIRKFEEYPFYQRMDLLYNLQRDFELMTLDDIGGIIK